MDRRGYGVAFPRDFRLGVAADFSRVFARPRKSVDGLFTVLARSSPAEVPRLGLAVSKKQVRLAVQRNRIKRLVRESFRLTRPALHAQDIVVIARARVAERSNEEITASLRAHWERLSARP